MKKYSIVVLGAGESGTGAAVLANGLGHGVFVSDLGMIKPAYRNILEANGILFEAGKHTEDLILSSDEIIKSPGIPDTMPLVKKAIEKGIPVIDEIEFASRFSRGKFICITGSNGKTTTTLLTHHLLTKGGIDAGLAGNVGKSFAADLPKQDHDWWVLEVSSFQLDRMFKFRADISILTNITPDHLDRYGTFEAYAYSKMRVIQNQGPDDCFLWYAGDPVIRQLVDKIRPVSRCIPFGCLPDEFDEGAWLTEKTIEIRINQQIMSLTLENLALQGRHNAYNSMAAAISAKLVEVRKSKIKESLADFQNVEHRLEFVASVHGIEFINDSKATNVNSTWYALESVKRPVIWIAGGKDKGNDYSELAGLVRSKVKAMICLGIDNQKIRNYFSGMVETIIETKSAEEAVQAAYRMGQKGDTVLLSPACASFDLFENYEERGLKFKQAVKRL